MRAILDQGQPIALCERDELVQAVVEHARRTVGAEWSAVVQLDDGEVLAQRVGGMTPTLDHGTKIPFSIEMLEPDLLPFDLNRLAAPWRQRRPRRIPRLVHDRPSDGHWIEPPVLYEKVIRRLRRQAVAVQGPGRGDQCIGGIAVHAGLDHRDLGVVVQQVADHQHLLAVGAALEADLALRMLDAERRSAALQEVRSGMTLGLGTGSTAATLGSVAYTLGGPFLSLARTLPFLFSMAWVPLIFLFARRYFLAAGTQGDHDRTG